MAHHWKGVCGFGTCTETLTVTSAGLPRDTVRLPTSSARLPVSTMPSTSSSVSVGRPAMK
jgi:hypothetical protein